jgi:2'-5' RNA ligase
VAVPLSSDVRDDVVRLVERVRLSLGAQSGPERGGAAREVRWVRMDGLHLTLRFLGPTLDERIPVLVDAVQGAAAGVAPFRVRLAQGGAFPGPGRPRVLWLGVTEGAYGLGDLTRSLEDHLAAAGWPRDERPFRAHLTLARSDGVAAGPATARALIAASEGFVAEWTADRLLLFESHTGGGPARYEALSEVILTG